MVRALFVANGDGYAREILDGTWSRAMQLNRLLIKHGLPYRVRSYPLSELEARKRYDGYAISQEGLTLGIVM